MAADIKRGSRLNRRLVLGMSLGLAVMLGFALSLRGTAKPVQAQQVDRAAVVQRFFATSNQGDVDGAMAQFTDSANTLYVSWALCGRATPCVGAAAIRSMLDNAVSSHQLTTVSDLQVSGTVVTGHFQSSSDTFRAAGADRIVGTFLAEVVLDKIAGFVAQTDLTDAQTALNAGAPQAPPAP